MDIEPTVPAPLPPEAFESEEYWEEMGRKIVREALGIHVPPRDESDPALNRFG